MIETLQAVREVLIETLELRQTPPEELQLDSPLFGALPELDSLGVGHLVYALEERFDIRIEDDEFGADLFETVGTLTDFIRAKVVG